MPPHLPTTDRPARKKAPRRTAQRILEVALDLFNRRGEPNVATQMLAAELGISPGNLHYHYPTKAALVNALFDHFEAEHTPLLAPPAPSPTALLAWLGELQALAWDYRFLFRDTSDLLTRNHHIEVRLPAMLLRQEEAVDAALAASMPAARRASLVTALMLVLNHWVGHEFTRDPRHGLDNERREAVATRALAHMRALLDTPLPLGERGRG